MAISTNSIIHYTKSIDSLKKILEEGFLVNYCNEEVISSENGRQSAAFPMVSFCDIPLSHVKEHLKSYGNFGIGLHKDWANKQKLNPVLYFDKESELTNYFRIEFKRFNEKYKKNEIPFEDFEHLIKFFSYSKNYEGNLLNNPKYRFYNEREWRYVPNIKTLKDAKPWVYKETYNKDKKKFNDELNHIRLTFEPKDISYIIIKDEKDIKEILPFIRNLFSNKCSMQELEILLTRIITTDQIQFDF